MRISALALAAVAVGVIASCSREGSRSRTEGEVADVTTGGVTPDVGGRQPAGGRASGGDGLGGAIPGASGASAGGARTGGAAGTGAEPASGGATGVGGATWGGARTGGTPTGGDGEATSGASGASAGGAWTGGTAGTGADPASGGTTGANTGGLSSCAATNTTSASGTPGPSCNGMTGTECQGDDCCTTLLVPGGTVAIGRSNDGCDAFADGDVNEQDTSADGDPEHLVVISGFYLDKYEVTVGRFRRFVHDGTLEGRGSWAPAAGTGTNSAVEKSHPDYDTGWQAEWDSQLPTTVTGTGGWDDVLTCHPSTQTWTVDPAGQENRALECASWYEAVAFCIWDGGRLPTAAEWEHASAGGEQNRLYPWGATAPANDCTLANWVGCAQERGVAEVLPAGSSPEGAGRWGHQDLAANLMEWVFDYSDPEWYDEAAASGENVCNAESSPYRVVRGGHHTYSAEYVRSVIRTSDIPATHSATNGFRCARDPP